MQAEWQGRIVERGGAINLSFHFNSLVLSLIRNQLHRFNKEGLYSVTISAHLKACILTKEEFVILGSCEPMVAEKRLPCALISLHLLSMPPSAGLNCGYHASRGSRGITARSLDLRETNSRPLKDLGMGTLISVEARQQNGGRG